jgi:outer membrane immunogenic protein
MRKLSLVSIALAGAALAASPALAQTDDRAPFDGLYVGGSFGGSGQSSDVGSRIAFDRDRNGSFGDTVTTATGANAFSPGFCDGRATSSANVSCGNDKDGIDYAARVGFDKQVHQNFVIGVVGEFGKADINDSVSAFSTTPDSYTMTRSLRYNANIRGRIGYTPGTTLFYATGGGAYGRIRNEFFTTNTTNSFATNGSKNAYGYTVGGGVEQKIGNHISVGLEYLFTDLKDDKARVAVGAGTAPATSPFLLAGAGGTDFRRSDDQFRWHSVRATVAFRF